MNRDEIKQDAVAAGKSVVGFFQVHPEQLIRLVVLVIGVAVGHFIWR